MGLFDVFKKEEADGGKKEEAKKAPEIKVEGKSKKEVKPKLKKEIKSKTKIETKSKDKEKPVVAKVAVDKVGTLDIAHCVLKEPHVSEKSTDLVAKDQYTFKVWPRANKNEIKKSIEDIYSVDVVGVKIIKVPRRKRRLGGISGWKKGYKKAIVKIKKGQKIEVLPR
jgi:large subunit ribosomal protein L23